MNAMFSRLDEFAQKLPEPRAGDGWDAYYQQHIRNAEQMRAEAVKYALQDLGRGLRAAVRRLGAVARRAQPGFAPAARPADAPQEGAD
jgi:hypothetical protein